jgi:hypothetical protein
MFSGVNEGMAQLWKARQSPALLRLMLAQLAGALGHIDAASNWMDRALEAAIQQKVPLVLVMLGPRAVMVSLRGCEWENAVEAAVTFGRAQVFVDQKRLEGSAMIEDFDSFEPLEAPLEAQQRSQAEQLSLFLLSRALVAEMGGRLPMESSLGEELAGVIEAFALSAEIAAAWRAFAMVVRLWTSPSVTIQQHKTALEETSDVGSDNARFAAHGLLSFRSDAELKQSVLSQALILHRLGQLKSKFLEFSLSGYAEAICRHWAETVSREAFRFCAPRQLCEEIESFRGMAALSRAKMILRTVMTALSVPVPSDVVEWMAATDDRGGLASDNVQQEI